MAVRPRRERRPCSRCHQGVGGVADKVRTILRYSTRATERRNSTGLVTLRLHCLGRCPGPARPAPRSLGSLSLLRARCEQQGRTTGSPNLVAGPTSWSLLNMRRGASVTVSPSMTPSMTPATAGLAVWLLQIPLLHARLISPVTVASATLWRSYSNSETEPDDTGQVVTRSRDSFKDTARLCRSWLARGAS